VRGVYEACYNIAGLNSARTLLYLTAPSGKCVEVRLAEVSNASNEANEQCEVTLQKVTTLGTPTATTVTPTKTEQGDQVAGSTVKANVTASEPTYTSGPAVEVGRKGFASIGGYQYSPDELERLVIAPTDTWGVRLLNSPAAFDVVVRLVFREIG
jgi:hypothetical protein